METAISAAWTEVIEVQTVKTQMASSPTATPDPEIIAPQNASQLVLKLMNIGKVAENSAYSPNGKWLYMPSYTGVYAYDTASYKNIHLVSNSPYGTFSPSGKILMRWSDLFLTEGMQELPALELFPLVNNAYAPYGTFFSPDESLIAHHFSPSQADGPGVVKVWRLSDGKLINTFEGKDAAISEDNRLIAIGRLDRIIRVREFSLLYVCMICKRARSWDAGQEGSRSSYLTTAWLRVNGYTRILDPVHHKTRRVFGGTQAVFSHNEQLMALWERSYINVYRVSDGKLLSRFKLELSRINEITMRFSPDGQVFAGYTLQQECCSGYTANLSLSGGYWMAPS